MNEQDNKQQTQPNPELWGKFIEAVMSRRISGLFAKEVGAWVELHTDSERVAVQSRSYRLMSVSNVDHLCAELRRWMDGRGWSWQLCNDRFMVWPGNETDDAWVGDSNGLNDHLSAVLWVIEREAE